MLSTGGNRGCGVGATRHGRGGLLPRVNITAGLLVATVVTLLCGNTALAQPAGAAVPDDAPPLDRSHVLRVFGPLEMWIQNAGSPAKPSEGGHEDEGRAQDDADGDAASSRPEAVWATGVSAVRVELRWLGALVGAGVAESDGNGPTNVYRLVREASEQALAALERQLQRQVRDVDDPGAMAGLPARERELARVAPRLTLGLEVAGEPVPINVAEDAPATRVFSRVAPSASGLMLRNPTAGQSATLWPAQAASLNLQPVSQFTRLLKQAGLPVVEPMQIGRPGHGKLLVFPVIHRARARLGVEPRFLVRGHPMVDADHAATGRVEQLMRELGEHLAGRVRDRGSVAGRYYPSSDRYDPVDAPPHEAALVAYALARHVAVRQQLVIHNAGDQSEMRARLIMAPLLHAILNSDKAAALSPAALCVLAVDTLPQIVDRAAQRALLVQHFRGLIERHLPEQGEPSVGRSQLALVGAAAAFHANRTGDAAWRRLTTRLLDDLDSQAPEPDPGWLHWRVLAQHHSPQRLAQAPSVELPVTRLGWPQLSTALAVAEQTQVTRPPAVGPSDVRGGFNLLALREGPTPDAPLPDWRSANIVYAQGVMLQQPPDVAGDAANPFDRLLSAALGVRFLDQLVIREGSHWFIRSPTAAANGLRTAPWDNRVSPACTAMALLAACEVRLAVEP